MVSVLAAFTFASAIVMFMFARDIGVQVARDQQADLARYNSTVILPAYAATIKADQNTITTDQGETNQAGQAVASLVAAGRRAELQVTCEAQGVSQFAGCGQGTGLTGQGPVTRSGSPNSAKTRQLSPAPRPRPQPPRPACHRRSRPRRRAYPGRNSRSKPTTRRRRPGTGTTTG